MSVPPSETAMAPLELTLVLAATRDMGIGLRGTLPWTGLKKEMAYFARVTKRLPPSVSQESCRHGCTSTVLPADPTYTDTG